MAKYNYHQIMSEPIMIQQLTAKFSLPKPIALSSILTFSATFILLLAFFKDVILGLNRIVPGSMVLIYVVIPYGMTKLVGLMKLDGMKFISYVQAGFKYWRNFHKNDQVVYEASLIVPEKDKVKFTSPKQLLVQPPRKKLFGKRK